MLTNTINSKLERLREYQKTNIAYNRNNQAKYTNFLIEELEEILNADDTQQELNSKIELYKDHKQIDDKTGKYTYIYNCYLDLKRLKEV
jgi:hypothetical protein